MTASPISPERADLVEKLNSHYQELLASVQAQSEDQLRTPPREGEWSALQQLEHQILAENVWASMVERTVAEEEPDLAELWRTYRRIEESNPFPPPSEPRSLSDLRGAVERRHEETLALLDSIPDEALSRKGRNTGFGDLTVLQMFRAVYRHHRMHIDQIEGREPSFQPRRAQ